MGGGGCVALGGVARRGGGRFQWKKRECERRHLTFFRQQIVGRKKKNASDGCSPPRRRHGRSGHGAGAREREKEREEGAGRRRERGGPDVSPPSPPLLQAALLGLHAALEPLLGTDIAELDANVREGIEREREETRGGQLRGGSITTSSLPTPPLPQPDPVHRARTAQALATAAASLIRTAEGAAGRPLAAGEGVGAELAAVARAARAAARLEVALASGGGGGEAMRKGGRRV